MKTASSLLFFCTLLFLATNLRGQTEVDTLPGPTRNVFCFIPSKASKINGLSLGLANFPDYDNFEEQTINGLSIELLGAGWATPFILAAPQDEGKLPGEDYMLIHNGILLGTTLYSQQMNGISISALIGTHVNLKGLSVSCFNLNLSHANGVMIGGFNYGGHLKGSQFGFCNMSDSLSGTQVGVINATYSPSKGLQVGLLNFASSYRGIQLGLWNKNEKRSLPFINWQFKPSKKRTKKHEN